MIPRFKKGDRIPVLLEVVIVDPGDQVSTYWVRSYSTALGQFTELVDNYFREEQLVNACSDPDFLAKRDLELVTEKLEQARVRLAAAKIELEWLELEFHKLNQQLSAKSD